MKISRAIGIQTLAICTGLLLLAAATAFSWNRIDSAHQNKGKDSLILLDFRLLQESVKAWLLNNDLIYGSGQTFLVHGTKQQALQCIELAQNIRQSPLGEPFTKTVDSILNQLDGNQKNLDAFQGLSLEQNRPLFEHSVAQWDATSPKMVQYLELLGAQLKAAATENSALIEKQRQNFILIALLAFLGLGLIVFALWRWLSHLIVKPLRVLVNSADFALKNNQHFEVKNSKIFEIETLGKSLNAFVLNLEQRVQQRTQQLEEKQQQLLDEVKLRKAAEKKALKSAAMANASNAAKSEFLANMSHEIRTPLNGIIGSTELLLNDCPNESTVKWLHTIQTSGNHLLELINVVLDFSKIEARQLELTVKTFSLYDLLRNCRAIAQTKSDGSNLALVFKIDPLTPSELHGDRLRICQILTNLLNNAFKFTETGTVTLRLHHELEDDNHINLYWEIEDTGIGISKDALAKVFTPFVQLESGTTRRFAGTGLGLAISQQLAHMMGGGIGLESTEGKGSIFRCKMRLEYEKNSQHKDPGILPGEASILSKDTHLKRVLTSYASALGWKPVDSLAQLIESNCSNKTLLIDEPAVESFAESISNAKKSGIRCILLANALSHSTDEPPVNTYDAVILKPIIPDELTHAMLSAANIGGDIQAPAQQTPKFSGHVLLVEDNEVNQLIGKTMLEVLGLQVSIASNGQDALDHLSHETVDLILMDWHMPIMDGITATRKIRETENKSKNHSTPIVVVTADIQQEHLETCYEAGVNSSLTKPYKLNDLVETLNEYLEPC